MDMRDFINVLKEAGELVEVNEEISWDLEASALAAMSQRLRGPALLFNKVKGVPKGHRMVAGHFDGTLHKPHRRICMAMDIEPDKYDFFEGVGEIAKKMQNVILPVEVATAPCKEVIKMGKDVNLFEFPFVYGGLGDCGRYLMSNITIGKDPDSDWTNWGNYATLVATKNRMATCASVGSDFYNLLHSKYWPRGEKMPVAIAVGGDPLCYLLAGTGLPKGVSEADVAGGMRGAPIELVKCETSDILVPADAEIIFEGEIRPGETILDGPKTEAYGFTVGPRTPAPAVRINCVTHRKNPIVAFLFWVGYGVSSLQAQELTMLTAGMNAGWKSLGLPIKSSMFTTTKWGGYSWLFGMRNWTPGFIRDTVDLMCANAAINCYNDILDVVDEEVNIYRPGEYMDAMYTQSNPVKDWWPSSHSWSARASGGLVSTRAYLEREDLERMYGKMTVSTGFWHRDNTTKSEPPLGVKRMTFESVIPDETQKWVMDNWQKWGFKEEPYWDKKYLDAPRFGPAPII